jgi:hypothetical protein
MNPAHRTTDATINAAAGGAPAAALAAPMSGTEAAPTSGCVVI